MKIRLLAVFWLSCLLLSPAVAGELNAAKYPPGLRWREINRGRITIVFPAARSAEAEAALATAERQYKELGDFWRSPFQGRVRIVLDDSTDQANGFATFYPFNLVGVNLAEPPPDSELAAGRAWLDLVLAHELTHIFTLNAGSPLFRAARRIFGNAPDFFPAAQMPPWAIEGLAVYGESRATGDGRLDHAPYRLMLDAARRDNLFPGWKSIAGLPAAWPGPTSRYLYGAGFMEFLEKKYGADGLKRYLDRVSSQLILFGSSRDFKKAFGEPLTTLWNEYEKGAPAARKAAPEAITREGFSNRYPCALGENSLAYYHRDFRGRGAVQMVDLPSGRNKVIFRMDAVNSLYFAGKEEKLYLSATDLFHHFSDYSDLYEFDLNKGKLKRLSRGKRLSHPVSHDDSGLMYCVQRRNGSYRLALFSKKTGEAKSISMAFAGMSQISVSPGGRRIAAAVKPVGGPWGIAIFLESGNLDRFLTVTANNLSQPRWQDDEKLVFIVNGRETSSLASYSLDMNSGWRLDDPRFSGTRQFDLAANGQEIFHTYFSGRGEEIARSTTKWTPLSPMEITVAAGISAVAPAVGAATPVQPRAYRPIRDLLPHWWTPALRADGDEIQAGIITGGQDALGIHSYDMEGYFGFSSHRPSLRLRYVYDGLFPTLSFTYSYRNEYYRDASFFGRSQELTLASYWPLRLRKRSRLYAYADVHLEKNRLIHEDESHESASHYNGLRLGLDLNSAREYHDSISAADGIHLTLQGTWQPSGLGNKQPSRSAQADLRVYQSLARPGVLAGRLVLARSWEAGSSYYDLGGREEGGGLGNDRPFRLLRGFPAGQQWGDRGWLVNLEYRLPLFKIEKAILPAVSLDRVWLSPFFDAGRLASRYGAEPVAYAIGAEAVLRLAFGGAMATDLAFGIAYGFGEESTPWIYLRMGRSF